MAQAEKTDNHALGRKMLLRRHFLDRFGASSAFDCCQGSRAIWTQLLSERPKIKYFGVDLKPQKGRLKVDSIRVLQSPGWDFDVIDVDTYGSPWKHWFAILGNLHGRGVTVFLTIGMVRMGGGNYDRAILPALGIPFDIPNGIGVELGDLALLHSVARCSQVGYKLAYMAEVPNVGGSARYVGVRLEPAAGADHG